MYHQIRFVDVLKNVELFIRSSNFLNLITKLLAGQLKSGSKGFTWDNVSYNYFTKILGQVFFISVWSLRKSSIRKNKTLLVLWILGRKHGLNLKHLHIFRKLHLKNLIWCKCCMLHNFAYSTKLMWICMFKDFNVIIAYYV